MSCKPFNSCNNALQAFEADARSSFTSSSMMSRKHLPMQTSTCFPLVCILFLHNGEGVWGLPCIVARPSGLWSLHGLCHLYLFLSLSLSFSLSACGPRCKAHEGTHPPCTKGERRPFTQAARGQRRVPIVPWIGFLYTGPAKALASQHPRRNAPTMFRQGQNCGQVSAEVESSMEPLGPSSCTTTPPCEGFYI